MNTITLKGVLYNIRPSHKIKDVEYDQANLIVPRCDGKEDCISLKFKKEYNSKFYIEKINFLTFNLNYSSLRI